MSNSYYQVYKTTASDKINLNFNSLVYEDNNCSISYDFWQDEGNIGFKFFNKTDENIYLNLDESFFILNGIAKNYYKNRTYTSIQSSAIEVPIFYKVNKSSTSGMSVAYNEEKIVCIPPKTAKYVSEYSIVQSLYRDCELLRFPKKKEVKSKTFTKSDSPFVFSNIISYKLGQSETLNKIENEFYVSEIINLPSSKMYSSRYEETCGKKNSFQTKYTVESAPNKFYKKYFYKEN